MEKGVKNEEECCARRADGSRIDKYFAGMNCLVAKKTDQYWQYRKRKATQKQ